MLRAECCGERGGEPARTRDGKSGEKARGDTGDMLP